MPSPTAHGLLGATVVAAVYGKSSGKIVIPLLIGAILANLADFDFALVILTDDVEWHRGFSHSILFSGIVFICIALYSGRDRLREHPEAPEKCRSEGEPARGDLPCRDRGRRSRSDRHPHHRVRGWKRGENEASVLDPAKPFQQQRRHR